MSALSLKRFEINYEAQPNEDALHVVGRQSGLIAFLLSVMKIDPITELKCNGERVEVTQSSFFGRQTITIPMAATTGIIGGFKKPKAVLYAMIVVLALGIAMVEPIGEGLTPVLVALAIDLVLFIYYILNKEMSLFVQNGGDTLWGLSFKRSVIENIPVDIAKVNEAVLLINSKVLAVHRGG